MLVPTNPFSAHTCHGETLDVVVSGRRCPSAAFRPDDPNLAGYLTLDFTAFEAFVPVARLAYQLHLVPNVFHRIGRVVGRVVTYPSKNLDEAMLVALLSFSNDDVRLSKDQTLFPINIPSA